MKYMSYYPNFDKNKNKLFDVSISLSYSYIDIDTQINETQFTQFEEEYNEIYNREIVPVPFWYHCMILTFLSCLGILGLLLNGFVIWCFIFYPIVSFGEHNQ